MHLCAFVCISMHTCARICETEVMIYFWWHDKIFSLLGNVSIISFLVNNDNAIIVFKSNGQDKSTKAIQTSDATSLSLFF